MLKEISVQGISILIVEEKIDYLRDFANKIYVLESGRIVLNGNSSEILNSKEALLSAYVG
jgi:branched-chain amino acid transport system ATP-binding protein